MQLTTEIEQETDGRWIAEILELPGVMTCGKTPQEALSKVKALAMHTLADTVEHGEIIDLSDLSFAAA